MSLASRLRALLRPPQLPDPDDTRIAASLQLLGYSYIAAAVAFGTFGVALLEGRVVGALICAGMVLIFVGAIACSRAGRVRLASMIFVSSMWAGTTVGAAVSGGASSAPPIAYVITVMASGLLMGAAAAVWTAAVCLVSHALLAYFEGGGHFSPPLLGQHPWIDWAIAAASILATAALLYDTTRRLDASLARARASEARTRTLVEQASDGILVTDVGGTILEANERLCELTGYARSQLEGRGATDLLTGTRGERLPSGLSEGLLVCRDGREISVENSVRELQDGRIQLILRDITARKEAEAMLVRLRRALDDATEGVILFDADFRILYSNAAFKELYSGPDSVGEGTKAQDLLHDPQSRENLAEMRKRVAAGNPWSGRIARTLADGSRVVRETSVSPVFDAEGRRDGVVCVLRDVTREEELENSLRHAQKLEAVGRLAGGVAHDFNNLLTVILADAEQLQEVPVLDEDQRRTVDEIAEAAQRAAALTGQLLTFSRKQVVRLRTLDLNHEVARAADMLRRLLRENVALELSLDANLAAVDADTNQIHQVLLNLAANARDAMPDGGRLTLATGNTKLDADTAEGSGLRLEPGEYVTLTVADTGVGMDEDTLSHAFEPFFTTKEYGGGTGLGLASVHGIVEQSSGAIEVRSAPGQGTTARIYLPRSTQPALEKTASERAGAGEGPRERVLVVEDEAAVRRLVTTGLRKAGYDVTAVADGNEALALAREPGRAFELLVTDVILPDIDGPSVALRLREQWPDIGVLYTSGYPRSELRSEHLADAGADFLPKPFTLRELYRKVDELRERREQALAG